MAFLNRSHLFGLLLLASLPLDGAAALALANGHVVFSTELQESLNSCGGVVGALTLVAVGEQHDKR